MKVGRMKNFSRSRKRRFSWFISSEAQCHRRLERLRWPHGVWCPSCRARRISRFQGRGKTGKMRRLYTCLACRYQFTVTAGTFLHDSHLPLKKWFEAIFALCSGPKRTARGPARSASVGRPVDPWVAKSFQRRTGRRAGWVPYLWVDGSRGFAPKRLSARLLQRELKLGSYKTAWLLVRRIRRARERGEPLLGKIARLGRRR
jgi:transposase-like protein